MSKTTDLINKIVDGQNSKGEFKAMEITRNLPEPSEEGFEILGLLFGVENIKRLFEDSAGNKYNINVKLSRESINDE